MGCWPNGVASRGGSPPPASDLAALQVDDPPLEARQGRDGRVERAGEDVDRALADLPRPVAPLDVGQQGLPPLLDGRQRSAILRG